MTYLVILAFVLIVGSLAAALVFMLFGANDDTRKSRKMANALGLRVGFSILLFVCILVAWKLGYIHPSGIPAGQ